jgi:hypothetical protein
LYTSKGLVTLNRESFHFNKVRKLVREGAEESDIKEFLKVPALPDGIYEAYEIRELNTMFIAHKAQKDNYSDVATSYEWFDGTAVDDLSKQLGVFSGLYASMREVAEDWPEYLI